MKLALILTITYLVSEKISFYINGATSKAMIVGTLTGLVLGDLKTGIVMGGMLQAIYLGVMNIGGSVPSKEGPATMIATALVITTGTDLATGVAIAYPIGAIAAQLLTIRNSVNCAFEVLWNRLIEKNKMKSFERWIHIIGWTAFCAEDPLSIFGFMAIGSEVLQQLLGHVPAVVMTGLSASGSMMVAIGLGITLTMIWSNELAVFFMLGFLLSSVVGMNTVQIVLLAVGLAVFYYSLLTNKTEPAAIETKTIETIDDGGDFFE